MKKKLEDMNLLDNFLFGSVVTYPGIGEKFIRALLKIIFGREFRYLSVYPQKVFYGNDSTLHGTRLDVYLEEEMGDGGFKEKATIYDIEPDKNDSNADMKALPYRIRFYHAKIDSRSLKAGEKYEKLKNVIIIMIMPYDPFGLNRMVYTIKNRCLEEPEMDYEDGASTLFLYTGGVNGSSDESLKQLLHYMEDTKWHNAVNKDLQDIHNMIETVRRDAEVSIKYMRMMEEEWVLLERGEAAGALRKLIAMVCKKLRKHKTIEQIAEELEEEISVIEPICKAAEEFAPNYDCESVYARMGVDF